ncbi:MAG: type II toxin-antitoxin system RelE/ParE family toxin [Bdellovibrionales bacterium]|nr:type II toxin-antitoxin system RelE/ParE family toxin [Bdellovibrionales bacterium]MCB0415447.1 type II toxin-antitoxin system RelE/ParE family toxin [Bdellovibrionales bacterium]
MICSFGNKTARDLFHGESSRYARKLPNELHAIAVRKLDQLNTASKLVDLRIPPSNRLEPLKGELKGFYSIRINDQWRVVFKWSAAGPEEVQIMDYHK